MVDNATTFQMQNITASVVVVLPVVIVKHRYRRHIQVQVILVCHLVLVSMVACVGHRTIKEDTSVYVLKVILEQIVNHQVDE